MAGARVCHQCVFGGLLTVYGTRCLRLKKEKRRKGRVERRLSADFAEVHLVHPAELATTCHAEATFSGES